MTENVELHLKLPRNLDDRIRAYGASVGLTRAAVLRQGAANLIQEHGF